MTACVNPVILPSTSDTFVLCVCLSIPETLNLKEENKLQTEIR